MIADLPTSAYYDGKPFLPSDWQIVNTDTLTNTRYADRYKMNYYFFDNFFQGITVTLLNNIPADTIQYLANVTSDIQAQFQTVYAYISSLMTKFSNFYYDPNSKTQAIRGHTVMNNVTLNSISVVDVEMVKLQTSEITAQTINCTKNIYAPNIVVAAISCGGFYYQLPSSTSYINNMNTLAQDLLNGTPCYVTLANGFSLRIMDQRNVVLYTLTNNTSNYYYYWLVSYNPIFLPYKIEVITI